MFRIPSFAEWIRAPRRATTLQPVVRARFAPRHGQAQFQTNCNDVRVCGIGTAQSQRASVGGGGPCPFYRTYDETLP